MLKFWLRSPLMDEAGDASGGGDGAAQAQQAPQFDPSKFRGEILADVTKMFNGGLARLEKMIKPPQQQQESQAQRDESAADEQQSKSSSKDQKADPKQQYWERKLAELEKQVNTEKKAREEAETSRRRERNESAIRSELSKFQYAKPNGLEQAYRILAGEITTDEDGNLATPDGSALPEYFRQKLETEYDNLLAAKPAAGAGASAGRRAGARVADMDDIKPGMSTDERARVMAAIAAANPYIR